MEFLGGFQGIPYEIPNGIPAIILKEFPREFPRDVLRNSTWSLPVIPEGSMKDVFREFPMEFPIEFQWVPGEYLRKSRRNHSWTYLVMS